MAMPLHPTLADIALRLVLALLAGGLIGLNRETGGHAAGLRTTMLVMLAACTAMILANLMLSLLGKGEPNDFVRFDLMRLALGILTGIGFIGGGAILKRGSLITGITTAATMWMTTVIGLCFGAGQLGLGAGASVLTLAILLGLGPVDAHLRRTHRGTLSIVSAGQDQPLLSAAALGLDRTELVERRWSAEDGRETTRYQVSYRQDDRAMAEIIAKLAGEPDRLSVHWARMAE